MKLAMKGIIPDKQYQHDPEIKDNQGHTVCYYLWDNCIQVPKQWRDEQYDFPEVDKRGYTKAMLQVMNGQIPDKNNYHNTYIQDRAKRTITDYFKLYSVPVPNQWYDNTMQTFLRNPDFIQQVIYGIVPKKPDNVDPGYQNCDNWTVAMILALQNKEIPKEWEHKPDLKNFNSQTVAMILAQNKIVPSEQWNHNPELQDSQGNTVAMILFNNNILPTSQWMHDIHLKNKKNVSLYDKMEKYNLVYYEGQFVFNAIIEINYGTCCVCLDDGIKQFVKTKCGHVVCLECFQEMKKNNCAQECPLCRRYDWIIPYI